jgi:hypothetical protein
MWPAFRRRGRTHLQDVVDFVVVEQHAVDEIDGQHLAGAEAAFADDIFFVVLVDPYLRGDGKVPVLCYDVTSRPQAITIPAGPSQGSIWQS